MPTESPSTPGGGVPVLPPPAPLKCSICGAGSLGPTDGVIILGEEMERICASCVRDNRDDNGVALSTLRPRLSNDVVDRIRGTPRDNAGPPSPVDPLVVDLRRFREAAAAGRPLRRRTGGGATSPAHSTASSISSSSVPATSTASTAGSDAQHDHPVSSPTTVPELDDCSTPNPTIAVVAPPTVSAAIPVPGASSASCSADPGRPKPPSLDVHSKSLPAPKPSPWAAVPRVVASGLRKCPTPIPDESEDEEECAANPLVDVTHTRVPSISRGCLNPGSVFTGTQRSGRNSYDVTITVVDVNMAQYTLCGYLTIKDLTETHPVLTTFFDGEIIGPKYGFITGQRYGATEYDDMRHWERFEQFRRASTRTDIIRDQMLLRDALPEHGSRPRERDHLFFRMKERFLVPDHSVRDINGASFAGFYYAMIDFAPTLEIEEQVPSSPVAPRSPLIGTTRRLSTTAAPRSDVRRQSSSGPRPEPPTARRTSTSGPSRPDAPRRQSTSRAPAPKVATLRGYYFHSLNQEPFQELSLVHEPVTSGGTFELR